MLIKFKDKIFPKHLDRNKATNSSYRPDLIYGVTGNSFMDNHPLLMTCIAVFCGAFLVGIFVQTISWFWG